MKTKRNDQNVISVRTGVKAGGIKGNHNEGC